MNPNDYKFEVGDKVITIWGEVGRITEICECESCKKRGFYEPTWVRDDDDDEHYITIHDARFEFNAFYQIGKYKFRHEFDKDTIEKDIKYYEEGLSRYKKQLKVVEELEKEERLKMSCSNCKHRLHSSYLCGHPNHLGDFVQPYTVCADFEEVKHDH